MIKNRWSSESLDIWKDVLIVGIVAHLAGCVDIHLWADLWMDGSNLNLLAYI